MGRFIIRMVKDGTPRASQNNFIDSIEDLAAYSRSKFNRPFEQCSEAEQIRIMTHFEEKGEPFSGVLGKVEKRVAGDSFFATLKKYTVLGYGNSRLGATEGFSYDYIPGRYVAETTLEPGQKTWATS